MIPKVKDVLVLQKIEYWSQTLICQADMTNNEDKPGSGFFWGGRASHETSSSVYTRAVKCCHPSDSHTNAHACLESFPLTCITFQANCLTGCEGGWTVAKQIMPFSKVQENRARVFGPPPTKRRPVVLFGGGGAFPLLFLSGMTGEASVGLVGGEKGGIHGLHAGGAGEGTHQPVVYAVHMVDVHARQESDRVPINKVQHTDHAPEKHKIRLCSVCSILPPPHPLKVWNTCDAKQNHQLS